MRLSDQALFDITFPKGYSNFRIMDIWDDQYLSSDEINHIALCKMAVSVLSLIASLAVTVAILDKQCLSL